MNVDMLTGEQVMELKDALSQYQPEQSHQQAETFEYSYISDNEDTGQNIVEKLQMFLSQQTFISNILLQLQATNNFSATMTEIISSLGKYCQASCISIFENIPDGLQADNTFEWHDQEITTETNHLRYIEYQNFPITKQLFDQHKILCINNSEELPSDMTPIFPHRQQMSILLVAMEHNDQELGFIGINRHTKVPWNEAEITFIRKITAILATAISHHRAEKIIMEHQNDLEFLLKKKTTTLNAARKEIKQHHSHLEDKVKTRHQELYESESKFRTIVQQLSDLVFIVDKDGKILYVSPSGGKVLGHKSKELLYRNIFDYVYPDDVEYAKMEFTKTINEDVPEDTIRQNVNIRLIDSRGNLLTVEGTGRNALDNKAVKGVILSFRDITRQKDAEQKVQENLERQLLISDLLHELFYTNDLDDSLQRILSWVAEYTNPCTITLMSWDSSDEKNPQIFNWQSDTFSDSNHQAIAIPSHLFIKWAEQIKENMSLIYDYQHLPDFIKPYFSKDIVKRLYAFPISQHGITYGMMLLTKCIFNQYIFDWGYNEIAFMQNVVQIIFNKLEKKVANKELIKAKERAEQADNMKSSFLANMSHEIRTPMNGIVGFASLMQKEETSPKIAQYSQIINDNCQMLLQLLDDIIDISKIESKQLKISPISCNINQLLSDLLLLYQQLIQRQGRDKIEIVCAETEWDETISIDPVRLRQVLTNLVGNAIKFTDKGFVSFGYTKTDNHQLLFHVQDTGIGIPPKYCNNILFERFRQVEEHNARNVSGTGLGLAISKNLVEMMGGNIWVESQLGVGSSFYFTVDATRQNPKVLETVDSSTT